MASSCRPLSAATCAMPSRHSTQPGETARICLHASHACRKLLLALSVRASCRLSATHLVTWGGAVMRAMLGRSHSFLPAPEAALFAGCCCPFAALAFAAAFAGTAAETAAGAAAGLLCTGAAGVGVGLGALGCAAGVGLGRAAAGGGSAAGVCGFALGAALAGFGSGFQPARGMRNRSALALHADRMLSPDMSCFFLLVVSACAPGSSAAPCLRLYASTNSRFKSPAVRASETSSTTGSVNSGSTTS
mmetsp:Transcript_67500/g.166742  ORF Transcript_67500/g.166742 Transcript_67500/m.166742 type:complete len:247 (-) Transcript_67500:17-757(-)